MDLFSRTDLEQLLEDDSGVCLSLYMPTHRRAGREARQDSLRLKNLLEAAEQRLAALKRRSPEIMQKLRWARSFLNDEDFWKHQSLGLALFASPQTTRYYRLPVRFSESVAVDRRFHVGPLLNFLTDNLPFHILAISQKHVRLLSADRQTVQQLHLKDLPDSLAAALWYKEPEKLLQMRSSAPGTPGSYHGEGDDTREPDVDVLEFVRAVEGPVTAHLQRHQTPLILAGSQPTTGLYRRVNSYNRLVDAGIEGSPDELTDQELQERAWPLIEPLAHQPVEGAKGSFSRLSAIAPKRVSADVAEALKAAREGRVDSLLFSYGTGGRPAAAFREHLGPEHLTADVYEDLLEAAISETLRRGGQAFPLSQADMPTDSTVAAVMRY